MTVEEVELYKDFIKIGVPGVIGLFAGLLPYLIERSKVAALQDVEKLKHKRELVLQFTESISQYIGSSTSYISYAITFKKIELIFSKKRLLNLEKRCLIVIFTELKRKRSQDVLVMKLY